MEERCVVLLSGGMDSAVVLAEMRRARFECVAVSFDYGQRHRVELEAARAVARQLGAVEHRVVTIDLRAFGGSALTSDIAVPKDAPLPAVHADSSIPITYVPARNTIFLSFALALAEVTGARHLAIGINAIDYSGYPDCRPEFVRAFTTLANLATREGAEAADRGETWLRIHAPLMDLGKGEIVKRGIALGVDFADTFSCYDPQPPRQGSGAIGGAAPSSRSAAPGARSAVARRFGVEPCGHCDACRLRVRGFADAGVPDPASI